MAAIVYTRVNNLDLFMNASQVVVEIFDWRIKEAWTMLQNKGKGTCLEFNLKDQPREDQDNYEWSHARVTIGPC